MGVPTRIDEGWTARQLRSYYMGTLSTDEGALQLLATSEGARADRAEEKLVEVRGILEVIAEYMDAGDSTRVGARVLVRNLIVLTGGSQNGQL